MEPPRTLLLALITMLSSFAAADQLHHQPHVLRTPPIPKREPSVCEKTYGPGSVACGDTKAAMCYNPSIGQSCCADNGYCDRGQYCAPVAGYCCLDSEDLQTCATNAGFQLPPYSATNTSTSAGGPTATATAGTKPTGSSTTGTGGGAPQVQESAVARKDQWTLVWMAMGIGIVGVIMTTF